MSALWGPVTGGGAAGRGKLDTDGGDSTGAGGGEVGGPDEACVEIDGGDPSSG